MRKPMLTLPTLFVLFMICLPAQSATLHVDADASGANDGSSWADAYMDLQEALDAAVSGDEIWVAAGTYCPTAEHGGIGDRHRSFQMLNGVSIYGGFAGDETSRGERDWKINRTILSGDIDRDGNLNDGNSYHVFFHPGSPDLDSTAVLDGFSVTGGYADGSDPDNCGGGMYNSDASPTIKNCTFSECYSSADGGGMYNWVSSPTVTNCIFSENDAVDNGGGMYFIHASPTVINCTFYGNGAGYGGGLYCLFSSPLTLTNCTFSGNSALYGGGMCNDYSSPVVINCILWGNTGTTDGNEIYNAHSTPDILNSDIEASGGSDGWDSGLGDDGGGNIDSAPLFAGAGDLHLTSGSPCIDAGSNSAVPSGIFEDFEDDLRYFDGDNDRNTVVDIGADEVVDTDGDGILDYLEIYTYGTDPFDADTDGDGFSDGEEIAAGKNPLVAEGGTDDEDDADITGDDAAGSPAEEEEEQKEGCFIGGLDAGKKTSGGYGLGLLMLVAGILGLKGFRKNG